MSDTTMSHVGANIIKTKIPSGLAKQLGVYLYERNFINYNMLVTRDYCHLVLIFDNYGDAIMFVLQDVEKEFVHSVTGDYNHIDDDFDSELAETYGIYIESENYYYIHTHR